jgi:hypothetical protein
VSVLAAARRTVFMPFRESSYERLDVAWARTAQTGVIPHGEHGHADRKRDERGASEAGHTRRSKEKFVMSPGNSGITLNSKLSSEMTMPP